MIRTKRVTAVFALAALSLLGCFAHHTSTPLDLTPVRTPPSHERKLVVGVREPEIKLNPPVGRRDDSEAWIAIGKLRRAISLIRSMRASELYREVDFERQLKCAPDLLVEVRENPRLESCDPDAPWALLFLGVVPVWYTCDEGLYFSRVDSQPQHFEFPWHETQLFGWFVPILNLFPGWTRKPPPESQFDDTFRAFLLSHGSELLPEVEPDRGVQCPAAG